MAFFHHERIKTLPVESIVIWTWIVFTSLYVLMSFGYPYIAGRALEGARQAGYAQGVSDTTSQALQSFSGNAFQNGQQSGQQAVITQLLQELSKQYQEGCKDAIPVNVGTGSIGILSANCLQMIAAGSGAQAGTPAPTTSPTR